MDEATAEELGFRSDRFAPVTRIEEGEEAKNVEAIGVVY